MRFIAGIVVGLIVSLIVAVVAGMIALGTTFSLPSGTNPGDMHAVIPILSGMPVATQLGLTAAWLVAALCGAFVATRIAGSRLAGWAIALVVAVYFCLNAIVFLQPLWVQALWLIAPLLGGLLGNRLARRVSAISTTEVEAPPANP